MYTAAPEAPVAGDHSHTISAHAVAVDLRYRVVATRADLAAGRDAGGSGSARDAHPASTSRKRAMLAGYPVPPQAACVRHTGPDAAATQPRAPGAIGSTPWRGIEGQRSPRTPGAPTSARRWRSTWRRAHHRDRRRGAGGAELEPLDRPRPARGRGRADPRARPTRRSSSSPRRPIGATPPCPAPPRRTRRPARRRRIPGPRAPRADIVEVADALGLNLRYVPSMRNGADRSDRGNAILSDLPLSHAWAFELPLVLQRRVPVAATLLLAGGPRARRQRAPRSARPAGRHVARRGRAGDADDVPARAARRRHGHPRRGSQPRPRPARAELAAAARGAVHHRRPAVHAARGGTPSTRCPRLVLDYVLVRDRLGASPARASSGSTSTRSTAGRRSSAPTTTPCWRASICTRRKRRARERARRRRAAVVGLGTDGHRRRRAGRRHRRALPPRLEAARLPARHRRGAGLRGVRRRRLPPCSTTPLLPGRPGRRCSRTATRSIRRCWRRSARRTDTVNFEVYIFEPDEIGRQFMDAFKDRARGRGRGAAAGRLVRLAQAQARASRRADAGRRAGGAVPAVRAPQPGADLPAHPPPRAS